MVYEDKKTYQFEISCQSSKIFGLTGFKISQTEP